MSQLQGPKSDARLACRARGSGFTLTEILVTIGIIAMLAAMLLPAVIGAFRRAEIGRARTEIHDLEAAIKSYYGEYGRWPCERNGQPDVRFHGAGGNPSDANAQARVIKILRALDTDALTKNPKKHVFLEVAPDALDANGFFLDPWGNAYEIVMDTNFDNRTDTEFGALAGRQVAVWSRGPRPGDPASVVKSWE